MFRSMINWSRFNKQVDSPVVHINEISKIIDILYNIHNDMSSNKLINLLP